MKPLKNVFSHYLGCAPSEYSIFSHFKPGTFYELHYSLKRQDALELLVCRTGGSAIP